MSQACYQLRGTQKNISEIAMDCGYQSMRTFNRNFQNIIACTPLQFRNKG
ncbi:helix-turn-helix domain-containing protein [Jeotgalibaca porci]